MKKLISLVFLMTFILFLTGCESKILEIQLKGNPTTGFVWSYAESEEGIVKVTEDFISDNEELTGSPGTYTYLIEGIKEGEVTLTFEYKKPWEVDVEPAETKEYVLVVDKNLKVTVKSH